MPTVLITGGNRGIGFELVRRYLKKGWRVHACCRNPGEATELYALADARDELKPHRLDVLDNGTIEALRQTLAGEPIDLLINNAGIMGDAERQSFGNMNYESWLEVFRVNTMAPMKILEAFIDNLEASQQKHAVTISSGLGSITRQEGFRIAYSSSKSAVNAVMKSLSCVLNDRGIRVNLLSPGWVRTDMGGPDANLSAEESAARVCNNIANLGPEDTGLFIGQDGSILPW